MSRVQINKTSYQLDNNLKQALYQMEVHQQNSNYSSAENYRILSEKLKKDLQIKRMDQMQQKHEYQHKQLTKNQYQQQSSIKLLWQVAMKDCQLQNARLKAQMENRHQNQIQNLINTLQMQLPYKVKQSCQYLNLKKMQHHMAKQKIYTEAHKVQLRMKTLQLKQKQAWKNARDIKIQTAINTLKSKQAIELSALQKKINTGIDELNKEKMIEQKKFDQKYANIRKQLEANQDKQKMAYLGQFPSKGGEGSTLLLTKSKFLSSSKGLNRQ